MNMNAEYFNIETISSNNICVVQIDQNVSEPLSFNYFYILKKKPQKK